MFAAIGDTPYNIILFLHILTAFVAFAPAVAHPLLANTMEKAGFAERPKVFEYFSANAMKVYGSSLIVSGLLGFGVAGMSDKVFKMSQGWLVTAIIIWIAMNGALHAMILPGEKGVAAGDADAEKRLAIGGGVFTLLFLAQLWVMIAKPGL